MSHMSTNVLLASACHMDKSTVKGRGNIRILFVRNYNVIKHIDIWSGELGPLIHPTTGIITYFHILFYENLVRRSTRLMESEEEVYKVIVPIV